MATLDWHLRRTDGVTLVEVALESDHPERVRLESHLQPVWSPRRFGVPEAGWDETGFEGVIDPDRRCMLGYASPAAPVDPPIELTDAEPIAPGEYDGPDVIPREESHTGSQSRARWLIRSLGTATPERAVVPVPDGQETLVQPTNSGVESETPRGVECGGQGSDRTPPSAKTAIADDRDTAGKDVRKPQREPPARIPIADRERHHENEGNDGDEGSDIPPTAESHPVDAWFEAVDRRLAKAEELASVTDAATAKQAIERNGGMDGVQSLSRQLRRDAEQLNRMANRQPAIQERLEAVEIPLSSLERLA